MTSIYLLNDFYIGQTNRPAQRLLEHKWEALRNHRTKKDELIWAALTSTGLSMVELFKSTHPDTDELFVTMVLREEGMNLCNVAAASSLAPVERQKKLPPITDECSKFFKELGFEAPEATPITSRLSRANSVIHDYKQKEMHIEVTRISLVKNAYGGENTPIIFYKWLNTNVQGREDVEHYQPYTDSRHHCHDMKVGGRYVVYSARVPSPDDPKNTSFWSWENHQPMGAQHRASYLADRLGRIAIARGLPDFTKAHLDSLEEVTIEGFHQLWNYSL